MLSKEPSALQATLAGSGPSAALRASALTVLGSVFATSCVAFVALSFHLSLGRDAVAAATVLLAIIFALVVNGLGHHRFERFGLANAVTAVRAALVSMVAAAVFFPGVPQAAETTLWALVLLVILALALDGVDGYLARHYGQESALGARFDMEVDALLILCLSAAAFLLGKAGPWVLLIGMMRYGFVLAQFPVPRLKAPLPPSFRRKAVCVVQVAAMCLILVPAVVPPVSSWLAAVALLLLSYSFAVDSLYLLRRGGRRRMSATARLGVAMGVARSLLIYYGQPWRRRQLRHFYSGLISPGDLVFDIGAHVGSRSRTLLSLGAEVVAVEPQPIFADIVGRHLTGQLKGFERVAVGASEGETTLHISSRHPTVTTISDRFIDGVSQIEGFREVDWDREIRVPMTTLDRLIDKYGLPAFCKIDVEGAESDILRGLSWPIGLVAFEYTPALPEIAREAIDRLRDLGNYRFNRVIGERHRFVHPQWKEAEAVSRDLAALAPESSSGDVYARLMA